MSAAQSLRPLFLGMIIGFLVSGSLFYLIACNVSEYVLIRLGAATEMRDRKPEEAVLSVQIFYLEAMQSYEKSFGELPMTLELEPARARYTRYKMLIKLGRDDEARLERKAAIESLGCNSKDQFTDSELDNMFGLKPKV